MEQQNLVKGSAPFVVYADPYIVELIQAAVLITDRAATDDLTVAARKFLLAQFAQYTK